MERALQAFAPCVVSIAAQRRVRAPRGKCGGGDGQPGRQQVERVDGTVEPLPGSGRAKLSAGDAFRIETPGGGGFGAA